MFDFDYLGTFTEWRPYQHRVRASVDGQLLPMPINLDTVNMLYGLSLTSFELEQFFASVAEVRSRRSGPCSNTTDWAFPSHTNCGNDSSLAVGRPTGEMSAGHRPHS